jgi:hypothetical protein
MKGTKAKKEQSDTGDLDNQLRMHNPDRPHKVA